RSSCNRLSICSADRSCTASRVRYAPRISCSLLLIVPLVRIELLPHGELDVLLRDSRRAHLLDVLRDLAVHLRRIATLLADDLSRRGKKVVLREHRRPAVGVRVDPRPPT